MVKKQKGSVGNIDRKKMLEMAKAVRAIRIPVLDIKIKRPKPLFNE